jgi:hypothetical protein
MPMRPVSCSRAGRNATRDARSEWWEYRLRVLAQALAINLAELPRKKSAPEKLTLAAAMKDTTSVSLGWLARRLQMGATDSIASLLTRFRALREQSRTKNSGFRT